MKATLAVALVAMLCASGARADERPIVLKDAPWSYRGRAELRLVP